MAENNMMEMGRLVYAKPYLNGALSGLLTGVAAEADLYALRNISSEELLVGSLDIGFFPTTLAAAPTLGLAFAAYKVTGFTVLSATGARGTPPVPVRKRTLDFAVIDPALDYSAQVANTTALTGNTFTIVTDDPFCIVPCRYDQVSATLFNVTADKRWEPRNGIPISLAPNEGLIVRAKDAFPGTLVGRLFVNPDVHRA